MINEELVTTVLSIISMGLIFILLIFIGVSYGMWDYIKKMWGLFIYIKPKTGIDKEIADEEKEIAELKRRKEKIDRLAELKRYKKMLFEGVQESEVTDEYTHCRWCCGEDTLKTALTRDGISYHICTLCGHEQ